MPDEGVRVVQILVGTDLSERSQAALARATQLANESQAQLDLLHVVDGDLPPELVDAQAKRAQEWLSEHIALDPGTPGVGVLVRPGDPHTELIAAADEFGADLIVLGAHRRRLLLDAFIGTTAERLLRVSTRPALVAHSRSTQPYRSVLVATDLSETSARALRSARELGLLGERPMLVHVFHALAKGKLNQVGEDAASHVEAERTRAAQELDAFLAKHGLADLSHRVLLREGRAAPEIRNLVSELEPDLLVLGTKGLTGVKRAALGSVAESLMRSVPCDVLAVAPSGEA